jgi:hypothetical protein
MYHYLSIIDFYIHAGGTEMELQVFRHLQLPPASTPEPLRFDNAIYLTQVGQGQRYFPGRGYKGQDH